MALSPFGASCPLFFSNGQILGLSPILQGIIQCSLPLPRPKNKDIFAFDMGTNCAPLHVDVFLYSYKVDFVQSPNQKGKKRISQQFNVTYRYIDDVMSLNLNFQSTWNSYILVNFK